jgi:Sulfotransferase family
VTLPPFFLVGAQRSGTTMVRLMLNAHPRLAIPFESVFIPEFRARAHEFGDLSDDGDRARFVDAIAANHFVQKGKLLPDREAVLARRPSTYAEIVDAIFTEFARAQGKERWGDKSPNYVTEIDVLRELFPDCKIVHLVRDGRDVAVSLANISWGSRHIPNVAQDWRWKTVLAHKMGRLLGDSFLEIRYEDIVVDPERGLRKICEFLGEEWNPHMLGYHEGASDAMPESSMEWHRTSVKPPDPSKIGAWKRKMAAADQIIYQDVAGDALDLFGYERVSAPRTVSTRLRSLYYQLVKRW